MNSPNMALQTDPQNSGPFCALAARHLGTKGPSVSRAAEL